MWNNCKISVICGSEILFVNQNYATFSLHVQSHVTYPFFYQLLLACDFPSWMAILRFWLWVQWTNTLFDKLKHIQAHFENLKWKSGNFLNLELWKSTIVEFAFLVSIPQWKRHWRAQLFIVCYCTHRMKI